MTTTSTRKEKVYVLYGSQTGNGEQAAKDLCALVPTKLSPTAIQKLTGNKKNHLSIQVEAKHMQLDDFLELERCTWTRLTVIITSSYGVGQAPLGCYRFRELCDVWHEQYSSNDKDSNSKSKKILDGLSFAMCGLGDSKYTTFFNNPTKIHETLQLLGMKRVGPLGKADASGKTGTDGLQQSTVIERWMDGIWPHLAAVLVQEPPSEERLKEIEQVTVDLCRKINPDFEPQEKDNIIIAFANKLAAVLVALMAIAASFLLADQFGFLK